LSGRIAHITYYNRENHFTIARLRTDENHRTITIKGTMPAIRRSGRPWRSGAAGRPMPAMGSSFTFTAYHRLLLPATVDGIRSYLESGFIKGVGPRLVDRIIGHFKADTLTVIETIRTGSPRWPALAKRPPDASLMPGSPTTPPGSWYVFWKTPAWTPPTPARLLREYGSDVIDILCNDPYRVAEDIPRIGFRIADAIVRHADTPVDEMDRAKACMFHLFEQAVDQGHAYIARDQLFDQCREAFDVQPETGTDALNHLVQTGELVVVDEADGRIRPWSFPGCSTRPKP
jgi:exodeoxyribonuclease V alpha subunit